MIFDAINAARARKIDVVLADTAGRLPTQLHLMEEIAKVRRVIAKADPSGPHEVLLVLDANIGQNALAVKAFDKAIGVTGLVVIASTAPPRAACWRRSRASVRSRCASSASARASTTFSRSRRASSSTPCSKEAGAVKAGAEARR